MLVTERRTDRGLLVTVCDADVLGETFENGEVSLTVTEEFYGGDEVAEADAATAMAQAVIANLVGTRTVELAIDEGHVDPENVMELDGTLHAQFLRM